MPTKLSLQERFWSKVAITANPERCWEWQGDRQTRGYGRMMYDKKRYSAHRLSFFIAHGRWPDADLSVLHSCDNRACVNPKHLREGTPQDNASDMVSRNRQNKGSNVSKAKLSEQDVIEIRQRLLGGESLRSLSRAYGVARPAIVSIKYNRTWKHVTSPQTAHLTWTHQSSL